MRFDIETVLDQEAVASFCAYKIDPNDADGTGRYWRRISEASFPQNRLHRGHDADLRQTFPAKRWFVRLKRRAHTGDRTGNRGRIHKLCRHDASGIRRIQFTGLRSTGRARPRHDPPPQRSLYGLAWVRPFSDYHVDLCEHFPPAVAAG